MKSIMKKLLILIVAVCALTIISLDSSKLRRNSKDLLLVNIESLAEIENDVSKFCESRVSPGALSYQTCNKNGVTYHMLLRSTLTYSCDSKGFGSCCKGDVYCYYNCESEMIGSDDLTQTVFCN